MVLFVIPWRSLTVVFQVFGTYSIFFCKFFQLYSYEIRTIVFIQEFEIEKLCGYINEARHLISTEPITTASCIHIARGDYLISVSDGIRTRDIIARCYCSSLGHIGIWRYLSVSAISVTCKHWIIPNTSKWSLRCTEVLLFQGRIICGRSVSGD